MYVFYFKFKPVLKCAETEQSDQILQLICILFYYYFIKFLVKIYHEAKKFGKVYNINVVCAYGGGSMWEQTKACQEGAEIIVATPVSTHVLS